MCNGELEITFEQDFEEVFGTEVGSGFASMENHLPSECDEDVFFAHTLLLRFQSISKEVLDPLKNSARDAIDCHLKKYGSANPLYSYEYTSDNLRCICEQAKEKLIAVEYANKDIPSFQWKWLTNIGRLLPSDDPTVMNILPYLLTCYIIEAPRNKLDPFDSPRQTHQSGWCDIFHRSPAEQDNPYKSIESICNRFVFPFDNRRPYAPFFCDEKSKIPKSPDKSDEPLSNDDDYIPQSKILRDRAKCWEYYRCFVDFCDACRDIKKVNITLSMALFASIWDFSKDPDLPKLEKSVCRYKGSCKTNLCALTVQDVKNDILRDRILALAKDCGDGTACDESVIDGLARAYGALAKKSFINQLRSMEVTDDSSDSNISQNK